MQVVQEEAWVTVTEEAFLVDKGQAERLAVAEAEAELEYVPVGAVSAAAGLVKLFGGTLRFGYGQ